MEAVLSLSAYLAKAQPDDADVYTDAAKAAQQWILKANKTPAGLVEDTIHADNCERSPPNFMFTFVVEPLLRRLNLIL
jgi:hypothetical protein